MQVCTPETCSDHIRRSMHLRLAVCVFLLGLSTGTSMRKRADGDHLIWQVYRVTYGLSSPYKRVVQGPGCAMHTCRVCCRAAVYPGLGAAKTARYA